jgi:hypothetical protein
MKEAALFEEFRAAVEPPHRFPCSSRHNGSRCRGAHEPPLAHRGKAREPSRLCFVMLDVTHKG